MKFNDLANRYIQYKKSRVKPSTLATYQCNLTKVILPQIGNCDIEVFDKKAGRAFVDSLLDEGGRSVKSVQDNVVILKNMMKFADEELDINVPPYTWRYEWPTYNTHKKISRYTTAEYRAIMDYILTHPSVKWLGVLISINTGMRIGEVCALRWENIDFSSKTINVNATLERIMTYDDNLNPIGSVVVRGTTKTPSSTRSIPIMKSIYPVLKKFYAISKPEYYVLSCSEKPIEPRVYRNCYHHLILECVKLDKCLNFHAMRHTFASMLIESKTDVKTVSDLLGHSDATTTLNVYCHTTDENKRNAINGVLGKYIK